MDQATDPIRPRAAGAGTSTGTLEPPRPAPGAGIATSQRRGRWIEHWDPEDEAFWEAEGRHTARKNLVLSIFAEHLGFSIWVIWTIVVINLGNIGINLS